MQQGYYIKTEGVNIMGLSIFVLKIVINFAGKSYSNKNILTVY